MGLVPSRRRTGRRWHPDRRPAVRGASPSPREQGRPDCGRAGLVPGPGPRRARSRQPRGKPERGGPPTHAVKVAEHQLMSAGERAALEEERAIWAEVSLGRHPHIVALEGHAATEARFCLLLELASEGELFSRVLRMSSLDENQAAIWIDELLSALDHVLARHRPRGRPSPRTSCSCRATRCLRPSSATGSACRVSRAGGEEERAVTCREARRAMPRRSRAFAVARRRDGSLWRRRGRRRCRPCRTRGRAGHLVVGVVTYVLLWHDAL